MNLIPQKIGQAVEILNELNVDMWITFVRESAYMPDPAIDMVVGQHVTWQTAWIITRTGETVAVAGSLDTASIEDNGYYKEIVPYVQGIGSELVKTIGRFKPKKIAVNYSTDSVMSDGLTHGMYQILTNILAGTPYAKRLISSEKIIERLRGRKTAEELKRMKRAIKQTLEIFNNVTTYLKPGRTEQQVADFIIKQVNKLGVELAWDREHCPAVFTGPEHAGAHFRPTERKVKAGHVLNIDFGIKVDGYCSDLQRTWYIRKPGEKSAPKEVRDGFNTIVESITKAADFLKPGVRSWEVDRMARKHITDAGYPEYPHALGHQIGRAAHDGGMGLYPKWERYGSLPNGKVEEGQVFTIEPRLPIEGYGVATVEEMVVVTETGCEFLSKRQKRLIVV
ncbi:MAG: Xaa-Pro aminopeptidase [Ectothiorhodospiraceae bacterium]|nr:Xaa-Pro aminopeptidase [Ectothiorhodospiraceae bacterium]